jgi:hypothetical protein
MDRQGWAVISTFDYYGRLTDSQSDWLAFEDEVFGLKMDGSGTVERYAHHHSRRYSPGTQDSDNSVYFSEPHATVSRTGNKILFGSNWRQQIADELSIDAYLIDLTQKITSVVTTESAFRLYPNPAEGALGISFSEPDMNCRITILDPLGRIVYSEENRQSEITLDVSGWSPGVYVCQVISLKSSRKMTARFIKL